MRNHKLICWILVSVCLVLIGLPVKAAQTGSLRVLEVEQPVGLYYVAGLDGKRTEAFLQAPDVDLLDETAVVQNAELYQQYILENAISGWEASPDASGQVLFSPLEEGVYLVRSLAEEAEFPTFLMTIPTKVNDSFNYDVVAKPKEETPTEPTAPTEPTEPEPEIPQTGSSVWPKYGLLAMGALLVLAGFADLIRGREREV